MLTTIHITPSKDLQSYLDRAASMPEQLLAAIARGLAVSGHLIVGNAVQHRFTGEKGPFPHSQHKLGRITGRLRQSIRPTAPQIEAGTSSVTLGFGSNVKYFAIHEFGFSGSVPVKAHTRKNKPVRSHTRKLLIQPREPMQTELRTPRTSELIFEQIRRQIIPILAGDTSLQ